MAPGFNISRLRDCRNGNYPHNGRSAPGTAAAVFTHCRYPHVRRATRESRLAAAHHPLPRAKTDKLPHKTGTLKRHFFDPKGTEFEIYAPLADSFLMKIPKCEHPIITDVNDAILALNDLCELMDKRFDLLKRANVKNINEYNEKITSNLLDYADCHQYMSYIVVVIDEYADFIMTSGEDIEMPLVRLAQLAHSVGIHLVITTQRLTYNIITGIIRATFPTSIAFRVTTESESKVIIQNPDACKLLGKGDMLFAYISELTRVQCAFVDEKEINRVIKFIAQQEINQK